MWCLHHETHERYIVPRWSGDVCVLDILQTSFQKYMMFPKWMPMGVSHLIQISELLGIYLKENPIVQNFFIDPKWPFFSDRYLVYPHNSKLGSLRLHGLEVLHKRMEIIPPASKNTFPATFNNVHGSRIISSGILSTEWLGLASNLLGSFCDIARNLLGSFWGWNTITVVKEVLKSNVSFGHWCKQLRFQLLGRWGFYWKDKQTEPFCASTPFILSLPTEGPWTL